MKLFFIGKLAIITIIHHGGGASSAPPAFLKPIPPIKPIAQLTYQPIAQLQPIAPPVAPSYPVAAQGTYINTYAFGNCTAYVASRKQIPNNWGNANTWAIRAAAQGISVSGTPLLGSIAQESLSLGHVAIVIDIRAGQVEVSEMNVHGLGVVDTAWYPASNFRYIYI